MKLIIFEGETPEQLKLMYEALTKDGFLLLNTKPEIIELDEEYEDVEEEAIEEVIKTPKMLMDCVTKVKLPKGKPKYPYKKRPSVFSKEADEIIEDKYESHIDRELVDLIQEQIGEDYTYEQVKARRKHLGFNKTRGSPKGYPQKPRRKKYTDEHFSWLREYADKYEDIDELLKKFNYKFGLDITIYALKNQLSINGIRRQRKKVIKEPVEEEPIEIVTPEIKHQEELKRQKRKGMSKKAIEIIEGNYMEKTDEELRELIADKTGAFFQTDKIKAYRESNGMARPKGWNPEDYDGLEEES